MRQEYRAYVQKQEDDESRKSERKEKKGKKNEESYARLISFVKATRASNGIDADTEQSLLHQLTEQIKKHASRYWRVYVHL